MQNYPDIRKNDLEIITISNTNIRESTKNNPLKLTSETIVDSGQIKYEVHTEIHYDDGDLKGYGLITKYIKNYGWEKEWSISSSIDGDYYGYFYYDCFKKLADSERSSVKDKIKRFARCKNVGLRDEFFRIVWKPIDDEILKRLNS